MSIALPHLSTHKVHLRSADWLKERAFQWSVRRRVAREAQRLDSLPDYLLDDMGFPNFHRMPFAARQDAVLAALLKQWRGL